MIRHRSYPVEPWRIRETELNLDMLSSSESIFALSNGHIGLRGNLDEGEPAGLPGTYLNGLYELRPLPYAEAGYGYPESGQTIINVTNGKLIRLLVDDEPFDVRYGVLHSHERVLDLQRGVVERRARWTSPAGATVQVTTTRLVSFTQRAIAAFLYRVEAVDAPVHVVVQSVLVANEAIPSQTDDPRVAAVLDAPLLAERHGSDRTRGLLVHRTRASGLRVGAGMDHVVGCPADVRIDCDASPDVARVAFTAVLQPGEVMSVEKFLAYGWSAVRSEPAITDQVAAALLAAGQSGWRGLLADQRTFLDDFWGGADVEVDDPEIQQAVRFGLFHVLQAGARGEQRAIPAKGLTGSGYDGHCFWDTETFVLPVLTYTLPDAAADELSWRRRTLAAAQQRAGQLGLEGAAFPWRTIDGDEGSAYWPAGTAAFHINADIADAVLRYVEVSGDHDFERTTGFDLLVNTARLWHSLGHEQPDGGFRIDGVTGPDEYSALDDNNVYTNLMAERNLRGAVAVCEAYPERAKELGVTPEESNNWRNAAAAMVVPYDERLGVHPQSQHFTEHAVWDFERTAPEQYPMLLHFPYFDLYRKQVVKQADLVLALHLRGDAFTPEQKARNFSYYDAITVRDSSLSACTQAVVAAEVGLLDLAMDYLGEAALMDLDNLEHNTRDGLHLASLAGCWTALVAGFGGLRDHSGVSFAPRLPDQIGHMLFHLCVRRTRLRVEVTRRDATYTVVKGERLSLRHHGQEFTVEAGAPVSLPIPPLRSAPHPPTQPKGREPARFVSLKL